MSEATADLAAVAPDLASGVLASIATPAAMFEHAEALAAKHTALLSA